MPGRGLKIFDSNITLKQTMTYKLKERNYILFKSRIYRKSMILHCKTTTVIYRVPKILEIDLNAAIIICKLEFYKIQQR